MATKGKSEKKHEPVKVVQMSELMERLADSMAPKEIVRPAVSASYVEGIAKLMIRCGYQFNEKTLSILADYLRGYNLWLCGNVGVGKTFFFDCMTKVRRSQGSDSIVKLSMLETQDWTMETAREWINDTRDRDVLLDDVGTEPVMKSWGQEAELFPYLLEKRMQLATRRTHLTSNLGIVDIKKRYSERVSDRFVQYFKMETFPKTEKSKRVLRPWKPPMDGKGSL